MSKKRRARSRKMSATAKPGPGPKQREVPLEELKAILERARTAPLREDDIGKLADAVDTLAFVTSELAAKSTSIKRLRHLLFGASTEKTSNLFDEPTGDEDGLTPSGDAGDRPTTAEEPTSDAPTEAAGAGKEPKKPRKGHGRNGAASYRGAQKIAVPHAELEHAQRCPFCQKGKLYQQSEPATLLRVTGMAPLSAKLFELQRLRCNLCGEVATAEPPDGVGEKKYDESAAAMIATLKYGTGIPFNRLEHLQDSLDIPLPATTQWDLVAEAADLVEPAHDELVRQAAQGELLHNDDTHIKVLELLAENEKASEAAPVEAPDKKSDERTGMFTTGIVSRVKAHTIALFFTGRQHAGENLKDVLAKRAAELTPPIQMCDALSHNTKGEFETILSKCLTHARRKFVDVVDDFPDEVRFVVDTLRDVYHNDGLTKQQAMTTEQRLRFHQEQSGPLMAALEAWLKEQIDERKVEPNSVLGAAIKYMQKHWEGLTRFLHVAGAPLDNNICERALKKAILHRKNALFYKTLNGAHVGDVFMSLIHTAELNGINPFDYLLELQRHHEAVAACPADWLPWNYRETLARLAASSGPSSDGLVAGNAPPTGCPAG